MFPKPIPTLSFFAEDLINPLTAYACTFFSTRPVLYHKKSPLFLFSQKKKRSASATPSPFFFQILIGISRLKDKKGYGKTRAFQTKKMRMPSFPCFFHQKNRKEKEKRFCILSPVFFSLLRCPKKKTDSRDVPASDALIFPEKEKKMLVFHFSEVPIFCEIKVPFFRFFFFLSCVALGNLGMGLEGDGWIDGVGAFFPSLSCLPPFPPFRRQESLNAASREEGEKKK